MDGVLTQTEEKLVQNGHDETVEVVPDEESQSTIDAANGVAARGEQLVPVSEAKRYRKRAQSAEKQLGALQQELEGSRQALAEREQQLAELLRTHAIEAALHEHGAIDPETARLVLEQTLDEDEEKDVASAVGELKRRKPFLFRALQRARPATTLGPRPVESHADAKLEHAAADALTTGKRSDVLRYLRLRRKA